MDKLKKRLQANLLENPAVKIKATSKWYLPVQRMEVTFKRVRKAQMDILMKMMLLTLEEADIRRAANLSEQLLVEELFIEDLLKKMVRRGLIKLDRTYKLTVKGQEQLQSGIIEEEMEEEETELLYSSSHDALWLDIPDPVVDEKLTIYRYANQENLINEDRILEALSKSKDGLDENGFQTVMSEITSFEVQSVEHIPCLEFRMYNKEQDTFYARVWNTLLGQWDETLEKQIEEQEMMKWREEMEAEAGVRGIS